MFSTLYPWFKIAFISYLLGSISLGFIAGKICGFDLRLEGSGNIGATNAMRILGKKWGYMVFIFDFMKGTLAVILASQLIKSSNIFPLPAMAPSALAGLCVLLGHNFSIWLKFKGGKGVATSGGIIVAIFPQAFFCCLIIWLIVFKRWRYVSLASIAGAIILPVVVIILYFNQRANLLGISISLFICFMTIWSHRENIARLRDGREVLM